MSGAVDHSEYISKKAKETPTQADQMNDAAYTIGLPAGTTAANAVINNMPKAKTKYFSNLPDAYLAVQQGKVDAFAFDRYLLGFAITNGLTGVKVLPGDVGTSDEVAIGISKNSDIPDLQQKINDCLADLREDGTLDEMFQRWVINADNTMPDIPKAEHPTITLSVGTSGEVQPFSYYEGDQLTGYDLELSARLALALNATLEVKVYNYDGFAAAAEAGSIDCVLANLNITPERRETMDFSTALYETQTALMVADTSSDAPAQTAQTDTLPAVETGRVGVMDGSTNAAYADENYPDADIHSYKNYVDSIAALKASELDYAMMDYTSALCFIQNNSDLEIVSDNLTDEKVCLGISKSQPELAEQVSAVVDKFLEDGTMDEISSHWIKPDGSDYDVIETPKLENAPKIRVAIISSREPTTFKLADTYAGMDIELIDRVLYELGYQAEYLDMDLSGIMDAIESNKADMTLGLYNTPQRAETLYFTAPYFTNPQILVCRASTQADNDAPEYTKLTQLSGKILAAQTGAVTDIMMGRVIPSATFRYFPNRSDELAALLNNKVDGVPFDEPVAKLAVAKNTSLTILPEMVAEDHYGIALQKDSDLTAPVNEAIAQLKADGTLEQMKQKWTGADDSVKVLPELDIAGNNGTLRVVHDTTGEPMEYVGDENKVLGYDIELALRIGQILDRKVTFIAADFQALIPMLQSGKADIAVGCMSITEERKQAVDMSDPYYDGGLYLVVHKAGASGAETSSAETASFWDNLKACFNRTFIVEGRWILVLQGLGITVIISVCSGLLGSLLGFGICMLRRSKKRLASLPAAGFIRLIQGTPIVVLLMILYYIIFGKVGIPAIFVAIFGFAVILVSTYLK